MVRNRAFVALLLLLVAILACSAGLFVGRIQGSAYALALQSLNAVRSLSLEEEYYPGERLDEADDLLDESIQLYGGLLEGYGYLVRLPIPLSLGGAAEGLMRDAVRYRADNPRIDRAELVIADEERPVGEPNALPEEDPVDPETLRQLEQEARDRVRYYKRAMSEFSVQRH